MTFEQWFETEDRPNSLDADFDRRLAKSAWNAAINQATILVECHFDECEPWLTPEEMSELGAD